MPSLYEEWTKEREIFERYRKENPEIFVFTLPSETEIAFSIGIKISFPSRPEGYIRLYPQDFIVEEVSKDKIISGIEPKEQEINPPEPPFTIFADLVKTGISTPDILNSIAEVIKGCIEKHSLSDTIKISLNKIGYAGLKDVKALTSQKIAVPRADLEVFKKIKEISSPNFFLTNFSFGKGSIQAGELFGNRFTLFIRTEREVDEKWFFQNLEKIESEGFLNFFQAQRFGTPRYLSHIFGKLILQGKYEEAIFAFLTEPGLRENPLVKERRKQAKSFSPQWRKMAEVFKEFPYTFRNELKLLSCLGRNPEDFIGALKFFEDQTTLWVYSYTSYLFNLLLSLGGLNLPKAVPVLSDDLRDQKIYNFWLKKDGIEYFEKNLQPFKFIRFKRRFIGTRIFPQKVISKILPEGVALSFILEKGAYATTFLMNLFEIKHGLPRPEWLKDKEYDIKEILGIGSVEKCKRIFGKYPSSPLFVNKKLDSNEES